MNIPNNLRTQLSSNIYSKKNQIKEHLIFLRGLLKDHKFSNETYYFKGDILNAINYYKRQLNFVNEQIRTHEQECFKFGL